MTNTELEKQKDGVFKSYLLLVVAQTMSILFLNCEQDISWIFFNFFRLIMADHRCHIRQEAQ
jgi:hypothetical protein